jgi:ribbon-helix-helix CopG family protein
VKRITYPEIAMKTLSLKLPESLDHQLTVRARQQRTTKSALIREALTGYFQPEEESGKGSFLDLAGDLIGSLEGPGDLSFNKDYLKDYGR